ncbi:hypothetical protein ACPCG0_11210 [Propionibacteriaceae bacterium Y1923]|uniref:hypothetical protein n=1 Tax=Aestuariimicrobium sp. Y1814 TaxID=3418742 RepID=UPI003C167462
MAASRTWQRWLNLSLVVVGVLVVLYGAFVQGRGPETCRGVEMGPGDVCHKSSMSELHTTETQTYEQRKAAALAQRPTVIISGLVIAGFGLFLHRRTGAPRGVASAEEERLLSQH